MTDWRTLFLLVPLLSLGCASLDAGTLGDLLGAAAPLDEATVASGLREALDVGTGRAIATVSAEGGFAQDAATVYFRDRTQTELTARFGPVVDNVMNELGVVRLYGDLVSRYNSIPLVRRVEFDPQAYVVSRTLDGLFQTLAVEEARIRQDPVARTTRLLQRVFGSAQTAPQ